MTKYDNYFPAREKAGERRTRRSAQGRPLLLLLRPPRRAAGLRQRHEKIRKHVDEIFKII